MLLQRRQGWVWEWSRCWEQVVSPPCSRVTCSVSPPQGRGSALLPLPPPSQAPLCFLGLSGWDRAGGVEGDGALFFQEGNESRFGRKSGVKKEQGGGSRKLFLVLGTVCTCWGGLVLDCVGKVGQQAWGGWVGGGPLGVPWGLSGAAGSSGLCLSDPAHPGHAP